MPTRPGRCRSRSDRAPAPHAGFTLIEMIVVLVVLALVGSIVLARGPMHSARLDLRAVARTMASDMRTTRARAIDAGRDLGFSIDPTLHTYGERGRPVRTVPSAVELAGPIRPILFHDDGSSSGGLVTVTEGGVSLTIQVDWLTGRVSVK